MCDFGLADYCSGDKRLSEISGTPAYIAPEVIRQRYALPADIWSCGIVLYVLLSGRTPFHRKGDGKTPYKVVFKRILEQAVDFNVSGEGGCHPLILEKLKEYAAQGPLAIRSLTVS